MNNIFPNLSLFTLHETKRGVTIDSISLPFVTGAFYRHLNKDGRIESVGVYSINNIDIFAAWGYLDEVHCSYHAVKKGDTWSATQEGCPNLKSLGSNEVAVCLNKTWHKFTAK